MSILIKGMEMPKNCFDCMFHWHGDGTTYCLAQSKMHDLHHIKWECKGYEEQMKYREPTCPLVPVPPHGRLIDADEMYEEFALEGQRSTRYKLGEAWELNGKEIRRAIYRLSTVIPAEEGET